MAVPLLVVKAAVTAPLPPPVRVTVIDGGAPAHSSTAKLAAPNCSTPDAAFGPGPGTQAAGVTSSRVCGAVTGLSVGSNPVNSSDVTADIQRVAQKSVCVRPLALYFDPPPTVAGLPGVTSSVNSSPTPTEDRSTLYVRGVMSSSDASVPMQVSPRAVGM